MMLWLLLGGAVIVVATLIVWGTFVLAGRADAWADKLAADILGEWREDGNS